MLPSPRTYAFWLALLRMYTGVFWLEHGLGKLFARPAFGAPDGGMAQFLSGQIAQTHGPYHDFLQSTVVPNLAAFAALVQFGELATGTLLLLGLLTRVGALIGIVLALNYWATKGGFTGFSSLGGLDIAAVALCAVHLVLPTGRFLGLDAFLARRRPAAVPATPRPEAPPPRPAPPPIVTPPPPPPSVR